MKKFVIFMSIFLSISWLVVNRHDQPVKVTVGKASSNVATSDTESLESAFAEGKYQHNAKVAIDRYRMQQEQIAIFQYLKAIHDKQVADAITARKRYLTNLNRVQRSRTAAPTATRPASAPTGANPAPTAAPANGCIGHTMSVAEAHACWDPLINQYPWSHSKAFAVMYCESTGKSNASNGSHWGLFQLDTGPYYDPAQNVAHAYYDYYAKRGWQPWACA